MYRFRFGMNGSGGSSAARRNPRRIPGYGLEADLRSTMLGLPWSRWPAVAVRRHDHPPGHANRGLAAVIGAHQLHAQVDPGGQPGTGQHHSLVHPQHVRADFHRRVPGSELAGVLPVRGGPAVIKQSRRGQGEGTGTHRDHPGAPGGGLGGAAQGPGAVISACNLDCWRRCTYAYLWHGRGCGWFAAARRQAAKLARQSSYGEEATSDPVRRPEGERCRVRNQCVA